MPPTWPAPVLTKAPLPIEALVVMLMTSTMTEPVTAASPPPALPPTATEETAGSRLSSLSDSPVSGTVGSSVLVAVTAAAPPKCTVLTSAAAVPESTLAVVVVVSKETTMAPPTALPLVDSPPARARFCTFSRVLAVTVSAPSASTVLPLPIVALVVRVSTWMLADAATLMVPLPPAAASAHTIRSSVLPAGVMASTVMLSPLRSAPVPTLAVLVMSWTLRPTAAPMLLLLSMLELMPIARALASVSLAALTFTSPAVAWTTRLLPIVAVLVVTTQLRAMAAATPVPPPLSPDWLEEEELAESVLSLDLGSVPVPVPLVLELEPLTWLLDFVSALESLSEEPLALARALAELSISDSAATSTDNPVTLRCRSAVVCQPITTLRAMSTPTATFLLAASADPSVSILATWAAAILTAPVAVRAVAEVPIRAVAWSSLTMTTAAAGVMAVPPAVPASSEVATCRKAVEVTVTSWPPVTGVPSSISARVVVGIRTLSAKAAPTPVAEPTSALPLADAASYSLARALTVMSPVPAATDVAVTMASVVVLTRFIANAPAIPTSPALLAPATPMAEISCSSSRKSCPSVGVAGNATPLVTTPLSTTQACEPFRLYTPGAWLPSVCRSWTRVFSLISSLGVSSPACRVLKAQALPSQR